MNWSLLHDRRADEPPPLLHDRYAVETPIGQGRATVYRGTDTRLGRTVALKRVVLAGGHESGERVHLRALREARAAARLDHPSVVTVYDVVEEDDALWLVMELVDAPSLAQLVGEEGPLDHARAARIGLDVLGALAAAHREGIVHRDVKPANVLVPPHERAKLADFGVATSHDETRVTATGLVVGSPAYMAPEQARGEDVGPAADLWALGATLYFAYEGGPPFDGGTALATASAVVHGEPRAERRPGALSPLVARLLAKDPDERPPADEVRSGLKTLAGPAEEAPDEPADTVAEVPVTRTAPLPPAVATEVSPVDAPLPLEPDPEVSPEPAAPTQPEPEPAESPRVPEVPLRADVPPQRPSRRGPRSMPRRGWLILVALMIVAALAVLVLAPGDDGDDGDTPRDSAGQVDEQGDADTTTATTAAAGEDEGDEDQAAADPATTTTAAPAAPEQSGSGQGTGEVPAGWRTYTDPEAGYTVAYPGSWKVEPADGPRIDFRDPETGSYLRVDWTDQPKPDPVADWRTQSQGFAASHQGYEEITIAPEEYRDYDAARWEFRYTDGGARLHAIDLGFVVGDKAYALFFQTKEELWSANQDVFTQIRDSFRPAGD